MKKKQFFHRYSFDFLSLEVAVFAPPRPSFEGGKCPLAGDDGDTTTAAVAKKTRLIERGGAGDGGERGGGVEAEAMAAKTSTSTAADETPLKLLLLFRLDRPRTKSSPSPRASRASSGPAWPSLSNRHLLLRPPSGSASTRR